MGHPNLSPELNAVVDAIQAQGDPKTLRVLCGKMRCTGSLPHPSGDKRRKRVRCTARAKVYEGDPRARGHLRFECSTCGDWGDINPEWWLKTRRKK